MRTVTLFVAALLLSLSPLAAAEDSKSGIGIYNGNGEMFTFVERGITFSIFQNGEFDFYINPRQGGVIQAGVNLGGVSLSYNAGYDYDAYVQYDDYGAIIQIEDVPIFYDHYGRISQAGDVRIRYNNNRLFRVGGLYIHYNRFGVYSHYTGFINRWNRIYNYHPYHDFFVRPVFNRCIVSFRPYRRWYNPVRYSYFRGRGYDRGYRYRNYRRAGRSFRPIESRVRNSNQGRRVARRYNDVRRTNERVARRTGEVRSNEGVRRTTQRSIQRDRNRVSERRTEGVRRSSGRVAERNGNEVRRPQVNRARQERSVQRRSNTPRVSEQRRTTQRSTPRVQQERRRVERRTTTPRVRQQRATQSRTQVRKAPQRRSVQKPRARVQSSRKQQAVRKKSSTSSRQRNGNRRVSSKRRG